MVGWGGAMMIAGAKKTRQPRPIGSIVVRESADKVAVRMIKVRDDGPSARRWMRYARWWWEQNKGPIPAGKFVLHLDGDSLNDEPSNLALGSGADAAFVWLDKDPERAEAHYRKMHAAAGEHNRLRGRIKRLLGWNLSRWYPVDHTRRVIYNRPVKNRYAVWPAIGFDVQVERNGEGADVQALGWPGMATTEAAILSCIWDGELAGDELLRRVEEMRAARGCVPLKTMTAFYSATCSLGQRGMVRVRRMGNKHALYRITEKARSMRQAWTPVVPVHGSTLNAERFDGYSKLDGELGERRKVTPMESLALLAQAVQESKESAA